MSNIDHKKLKAFLRAKKADELVKTVESVLVHCQSRTCLTGSDYDEGYTDGSNETKEVTINTILRGIGYPDELIQPPSSSKEEGVNQQ